MTLIPTWKPVTTNSPIFALFAYWTRRALFSSSVEPEERRGGNEFSGFHG
jgi:hypothetical protein